MLRKVLFIFCFVIFLAKTGECQVNTISQWHGYEKVSFSFEGRNAYIVNPEKSVPGNPWIWRAYFPDWHYEMDSILVSRGFHIAFIDCSDMYGSPAAMNVWERFYRYMLTRYSLATRPALEGVSRGGLYIYGWAKRNPDKVSCIYAEAPVLDIKSWPGGKGKGRGSADDWKKCLKVYSFTESQALDFKDNPVDNIESPAAYKIPVIHVVCAADSIVPVAENTAVFAEKYLSAGALVRVDTMSENISLEGHHFNINHPEHYADFIFQHSVPVKNILSSDSFIQLNSGLNSTLYKIRNSRKLTVAFLGGSITYNHGWRDKVCQYLKETYPETEFTFIPAGIPSLGSLPHSFRLQQDVLGKGKVDLLFFESAVNDRGNGTDSTRQKRALEGIIHHALTFNPSMNIIVMAFADEGKNSDFANGTEPQEVKTERQVAGYYGLPFINLAKEVYERINNGELTWKDDFKDVHPSPYGQNIYFQAIKRVFQLSENEYNREAVSIINIPSPQISGIYDKGTYADIHGAARLKGFRIVEKWQPSDGKETREGFVNVPVLEGTGAGSSFTYSFEGNAVGIAVVSGYDAGVIEFRIDNGKPGTIDLYTQWSNYLHLPWYLILGDNLKSGRHVLKVRISAVKGGSDAHTCRIVHFLVNK